MNISGIKKISRINITASLRSCKCENTEKGKHIHNLTLSVFCSVSWNELWKCIRKIFPFIPVVLLSILSGYLELVALGISIYALFFEK